MPGVKYQVTKEECANKIHGVCSQCGGPLEPIETVNNSGVPTYWAGCVPCCRFDAGVSRRVYQIAKKLVTERHYSYYSHIHIEPDDDDDKKLYKQQCQIEGACGLVNEVLRLNREMPT